MGNREATENVGVIRRSGRYTLESDGMVWEAKEDGVPFATNGDREVVEREFEDKAGITPLTVTTQTQNQVTRPSQ